MDTVSEQLLTSELISQKRQKRIPFISGPQYDNNDFIDWRDSWPIAPSTKRGKQLSTDAFSEDECGSVCLCVWCIASTLGQEGHGDAQHVLRQIWHTPLHGHHVPQRGIGMEKSEREKAERAANLTWGLMAPNGEVWRRKFGWIEVTWRGGNQIPEQMVIKNLVR